MRSGDILGYSDRPRVTAWITRKEGRRVGQRDTT